MISPFTPPARLGDGPPVGYVGAIISSTGGTYLVEFDKPFEGGHNGNGSQPPGKDGCCWYISDQHKCLELADNPFDVDTFATFLKSPVESGKQ